MSAALRWLGGTEDKVVLKNIVSSLVGQWTDREGSIYTLTQGGGTDEHTCGQNIDVLTLRPSGERRYTKGLIRCIASGSGDEVDMFWGRRPQSRFVGTIEEEEG